MRRAESNKAPDSWLGHGRLGSRGEGGEHPAAAGALLPLAGGRGSALAGCRSLGLAVYFLEPLGHLRAEASRVQLAGAACGGRRAPMMRGAAASTGHTSLQGSPLPGCLTSSLNTLKKVEPCSPSCCLCSAVFLAASSTRELLRMAKRWKVRLREGGRGGAQRGCQLLKRRWGHGRGCCTHDNQPERCRCWRGAGANAEPTCWPGR